MARVVATIEPPPSVVARTASPDLSDEEGEDKTPRRLQKQRAGEDGAGETPRSGRAGHSPRGKRREWPVKTKTRLFMRSIFIEVLSMALTVYALFVRDIVLATDGAFEAGTDDVIGYITFLVALLFTIETALNSWVWEGYFCGVFFWLDMVATISLYSEVPWIEQALFGGTGTVARAGRAARVGTRVGRILRLVRLIRVLRLLRIMSQVKEKRLQREQQQRVSEQQRRVHALAEQRKREALESSGKQHIMKEDAAGAPVTPRTPRNTIMQRLIEIDEMEHEFQEQAQGDDEGVEDASSLANKMSNMMTVKVVVGVLFILLILPMLQSDEPRLDVEGTAVSNSLYSLRSSLASANNVTTDSRFQKDLVNFQQLHPNVFQVDYGSEKLVPRNNTVYTALRPNLEILFACESAVAGATVNCDEGAPNVMSAYTSVRAIVQNDSVRNTHVTLFIIAMLLLGSWTITTDSNTLALQITGPLKQLSKDMESIAMLDLTPSFLEKAPPKLANSIREMELIQSSFFRMKTGIGSFAKYAPMAVVKGMMRAGKVAQLGVVRKPISILFSDIAGFTTICEAMRPRELLEMLSDYFQSMSEIISRTDGILAEFIGDAILALWNCPQDVRMHGQQCTEAALQMQEAVDASAAGWLAKGYPPIAIRVGVHTAEVFVGNLGSAERMKYGVLGDGVNLASRLEELNKRYSTKILVSQSTYAEPAVKPSYLSRPIDFVVVKGKKLPTQVHEIMGRMSLEDSAGRQGALMDAAQSPDMSTRFYLPGTGADGYGTIRRAAERQQEAFNTYLTKDFGAAERLFTEVSQMLGGDAASGVLVQRCQELARNGVPPGWDGSEVLKDKTFSDKRDQAKVPAPLSSDQGRSSPDQHATDQHAHHKMRRKASLAVGTGTDGGGQPPSRKSSSDSTLGNFVE